MAWLCLAIIWHESQAQDAPKTPQDAPKMATRRVKKAPKTHARHPPRRPKTSSRRLQDGLRCAQDAPKTPYESPRTPQGTPRRLQYAPRRLQTSILVPRDLDFEVFWHRQTTPWTPWQGSNVFITWPGGMREAIKEFLIFFKKKSRTT